jgi:uncharacterized protein YgbK (DUF1537 family)
MTGRWLILADDLTGAADCAVAFARRGVDAVVSWGSGPDGDATVRSIDVDSRMVSMTEAAARQVAAQSAHWRTGTRLYKKIDSTLRGHPAAELAAQLSAFAAGNLRRAPLAVVAPAFPAARRHTREGRMLVDGRSLEETALWARDPPYGSARLPDILGSAGLSSEVLALDVIRAGSQSVHLRLREAERSGIDAVICDCTTEADLTTVAMASLQLEQALWVGSAGLAAALATAVAEPRSSRPHLMAPCGPILTVVGSLAEPSRRQARTLAQSGTVVHLLAVADLLLAGAQAPGWRDAARALGDALAAGKDVLLETAWSEHPDLSQRPLLAAALGELVAGAKAEIGGVVVTGGQTARALLSGLGVEGIRLIDEVEPGVPLGVTLAAWRVPVITKAGSFGDTDTLRRCLAHLRNLPIVPTGAHIPT